MYKFDKNSKSISIPSLKSLFVFLLFVFIFNNNKILTARIKRCQCLYGKLNNDQTINYLQTTYNIYEYLLKFF